MMSLLEVAKPDVSFVVSFPSLPPIVLTYRRFCFAFLVLLNLLSLSTWELLWLHVDGDRWYFHAFYFTNWTLALATLYFLTTLHTPSTSPPPSTISLPLLSASLPLSFLCAVVYWSSIFDYARVCHPSHGLVLLPLLKEASVHGGSAALLLLDLVWSGGVRLRWGMAVWPVLVGVAYHACATAWVVLGGGEWIYPFLDWEKKEQWLVLYATFLAMYALTMAVQALRDAAWSCQQRKRAHAKAD